MHNHTPSNSKTQKKNNNKRFEFAIGTEWVWCGGVKSSNGHDLDSRNDPETTNQKEIFNDNNKQDVQPSSSAATIVHTCTYSCHSTPNISHVKNDNTLFTASLFIHRLGNNWASQWVPKKVKKAPSGTGSPTIDCLAIRKINVKAFMRPTYPTSSQVVQNLLKKKNSIKTFSY